MIAGYTDVVLIGEGGLGRVYRAIRQSTGGPVAIKELREVPSASPAWHRAKRELEAMLRLKGHPYVVSVEEIVDGPAGPCLVMEYLDGGSLADRVANGPLSTPELLLVGQHVTQALAAAHEVGIVHRDVKPHNLLVGSFGQVKVGDFGIAALNREAGLRTRTQAFTLAYASPEELDGEGEIGPGADSWSFAATMLHLATGRRPSFRERSMHNDLAELEQRGPLLASIAVILRRCFEVDPAARPRMSELNAVFNSAMANLGTLAIARLSGLPTPQPGWSAPAPAYPGDPAGDTIARPRPPLPPPASEGMTSHGGDACLGEPTHATLPHRGDRDSVFAALGHGRRNLLIGASVAVVGLVVLAVVLLTGGSEDPQGVKSSGSGTVSSGAGPALSVDVGSPVRWAAFSPDGDTIATADESGTVQLWDAATGERVGSPVLGHTGPVNSVDFSPDGSQLLTAGEDGYAILFDVDTGAATTFGGSGHSVASARFNSSGDAFLYVSDHFVHLVDVASRSDITILPEQMEEVLWGELEPIQGVRIVTAGRDNQVKFWDFDYKRPTSSVDRQTADIVSASFGPDGRQVVTASSDGKAVVWGVDNPLSSVAMSVQSSRLYSAMFSDDGAMVVVAADEGTAQVFDAATGELKWTFGGEGGHSGAVRSAVFSPDGTMVATAGSDGTLKVWAIPSD